MTQKPFVISLLKGLPSNDMFAILLRLPVMTWNDSNFSTQSPFLAIHFLIQAAESGALELFLEHFIAAVFPSTSR